MENQKAYDAFKKEEEYREVVDGKQVMVHCNEDIKESHWKKIQLKLCNTGYRFKIKCKPWSYSPDGEYYDITAELNVTKTPPQKLAPDEESPIFNAQKLEKKYNKKDAYCTKLKRKRAAHDKQEDGGMEEDIDIERSAGPEQAVSNRNNHRQSSMSQFIVDDDASDDDGRNGSDLNVNMDVGHQFVGYENRGRGKKRPSVVDVCHMRECVDVI